MIFCLFFVFIRPWNIVVTTRYLDVVWRHRIEVLLSGSVEQEKNIVEYALNERRKKVENITHHCCGKFFR